VQQFDPDSMAASACAARDVSALPFADAYRYAAEVMATELSKRDAQEGFDACIEKRSPVWRAE